MRFHPARLHPNARLHKAADRLARRLDPEAFTTPDPARDPAADTEARRQSAVLRARRIGQAAGRAWQCDGGQQSLIRFIAGEIAPAHFAECWNVDAGNLTGHQRRALEAAAAFVADFQEAHAAAAENWRVLAIMLIGPAIALGVAFLALPAGCR